MSERQSTTKTTYYQNNIVCIGSIGEELFSSIADAELGNTQALYYDGKDELIIHRCNLGLQTYQHLQVNHGGHKIQHIQKIIGNDINHSIVYVIVRIENEQQCSYVPHLVEEFALKGFCVVSIISFAQKFEMEEHNDPLQKCFEQFLCSVRAISDSLIILRETTNESHIIPSIKCINELIGSSMDEQYALDTVHHFLTGYENEFNLSSNLLIEELECSIEKNLDWVFSELMNNYNTIHGEISLAKRIIVHLVMAEPNDEYELALIDYVENYVSTTNEDIGENPINRSIIQLTSIDQSLEKGQLKISLLATGFKCPDFVKNLLHHVNDEYLDSEMDEDSSDENIINLEDYNSIQDLLDHLEKDSELNENNFNYIEGIDVACNKLSISIEEQKRRAWITTIQIDPLKKMEQYRSLFDFKNPNDRKAWIEYKNKCNNLFHQIRKTLIDEEFDIFLEYYENELDIDTWNKYVHQLRNLWDN